MIKKLNQDVSVFYEHWQAKEAEKGVVLLVHGMAEHIMRYNEFATYLSNSGYHVYGYDQRGHGKTAGSVDNLGYFGPGGWHAVVEDVKDMAAFIRETHECPVYLFGHSMGSFVSRDFASKYSHMIDGLILSGTGYKSGLTGQIMIGLASLQTALRGPKYPSKLISGMSNNVFNSKFKPLRTEFDWLSIDETNVDTYINDPYCGTVFSSSFYKDLFTAVERVNKEDRVLNIRHDLPIHIFSGEDDPVGGHGDGVKKVYKLFSKHDVSMKLYKGRHEMLNEDNKDQVYKDILEWLDTK
ncbi:alpha/beta hydrolase [Acidaminobacter sp. JC074]|uniref:alpha/beta hydrolase n=1 Tax=Acidaminobacter sp. JC074 TaxID=2530199 RepID=UPI001F118A4D|nr:alpha/beta hydrolase [Acidaminobacter sp. JC074]